MQKKNPLQQQEAASNYPLKDQQENFSVTFLLQIINGAEEPIFVKDSQHRWVLLNDAFCKLLGRDREELIGKSDYDFLLKAEADVFWEKDQLVLTTGITNENEEYLTNALGVVHLISTKKWLFVDDAGNKFLIGSIRESTKYRQVEAELHSSKQLLQLVMDNIPQAIFWKDRDSVYLGCNEKFAIAAGVGSPEKIVGKTDHDLAWKKEDADWYQECDRRVIESQRPEYGLIETQLQADGRQRWVETNRMLLCDQGGKIIGILGNFADITIRKEAELALQQLNNQLEDRVEERTAELSRAIAQLEQEVSERLAALRELTLLETRQRSSQQLLQLVMDNIPQLIFWKDSNLTYLGCNQNFARVAGLDSPENIVGLTDYDLPWTKEESDWYQECDRRVMESGIAELHIIETQQQIEGKLTWADTNKIPLRDAQGNVVGILGTYEDITERKRTEEALHQSEANFQKLSANVPGMLYQFRLQPDGSVSFPYVNSGSYELCGLTPEEIFADPQAIISLMHPDELQEFQQSVAISAQTLQPWLWERRMFLPGEQIKWVQAASRPELQADGSIIWDGLMMDITRSKEAEEALQQAYAELERRVEERTKELARSNQALQAEINERQQIEIELRASQQRLAMLIQQTPIGVIEWNTKLEIQEWNPAAEKIFGYSRSEVLGCYFKFLVPDIAREYVDLVMTALLEAPEKILGVNENLTKDNRTIICEWYNNPLVADNGEVISIASMVLDITERKQAEQRLKQQAFDLETAIQELQHTQMQLIQSEKMSGLGQLVAGVAHEINNPVNFIYGNLTHANDYIQDLMTLVRLYQQYYSDPAPQIQEIVAEIDLEFLIEDLPKLLKSIEIGAQRIREIVVSLRTFSRMDEAEMKEVNIHEGIDSTLMILDHRVKATPGRCGIQVVKEYGNLPLVECYAGQLNQVFMNILANAIDALEESISTQKMSNNPQIHIRTQFLEANKVTISIADNGVGIPEEVQNRLFDPFFTTKPIGKGTGMGLSISYQIISQRHGGSLECFSQLGNGSEFVITIPLHQ
ncbi:PAS domain S-box [Cylindrospermum stagnale PCC 7417]|uniref:histidine kinase n=1 Tax=Cylindrospermum stagnale PCC 7417 TaxID=56107 RepID=K9X4D8_9NOST|nr:PAS domain S-box protein [Cylindrospermum stagnale]AFZ26527.1 PAS domain S-box [Cylindrospermum stagnale PCC 7417]